MAQFRKGSHEEFQFMLSADLNSHSPVENSYSGHIWNIFVRNLSSMNRHIPE